MIVEVKSIQHTRQLDEINDELRKHIYEEDEYEKYSITQMKNNDNDIAQRQIPLIWNPKQNEYNELDNLKDAIKLDTLNEIVENHDKEENKYEYYNNLLEKYDMNYLQNLIET